MKINLIHDLLKKISPYITQYFIKNKIILYNLYKLNLYKIYE